MAFTSVFQLFVTHRPFTLRPRACAAAVRLVTFANFVMIDLASR
jgi:hypothetical protein